MTNKTSSEQYQTDKASKILGSNSNINSSNELRLIKEYCISNNLDNKKFIDLVTRRSNNEPFAYLVNNYEFYGIDLFVDNRVLQPRTETETIVEEVLRNKEGIKSLLDIGTGSGAIAIAVALNSNIFVSASEVSKDALDVAKKNVRKYGLKVNLILSDLFENIDSKFDVITANLPYVTTNSEYLDSVKHEPAIALFGGGNDGLKIYRQFFIDVTDYLDVDGRIYLESDPWQQPEIILLAKQYGFTVTFQDYFILGFCK